MEESLRIRGKAGLAEQDQGTGKAFRPPFGAAGPGLIWAFDLGDHGARAIETCDAETSGFRWLHLSLAHQGSASWISRLEALPEDVREMMVASDSHQRAIVEGGAVGCVIHDFERDFERSDSSQVGVLRFALTPEMMITARLHPIRSADVVRQKLARGPGIEEPGDALDLLIGTVSEGIAAVVRELGLDVQRAEDAFLDGRHSPSTHGLIGIRRRLAMVNRMLDGLRAVFRRLEGDEDLPEAMLATVERLNQRIQALGADALGVQRQIHQLREEIDISVDQRTNQNLYVLSIMTALMLPATFVTGLFGMNTGGLPWAQAPHGTLLATLLALGTAGATYLFLRWMGFMRR
ncbi:magnesium transporter CorA [Rhizorhabdus dicambivorans]|uniref:Magnesium transporter CorA n=1 Tax=Rhizorhabdus dicambivorans TaxID=1850238 RepID=A0A2A4FS82_9SPHN|nr:magnesium transporter CorA [Rhizorhabdus dicambivorans]PCE41037.1 magnesium transporter CorA [Rhizorhabdus dicambivorans]